MAEIHIKEIKELVDRVHNIQLGEFSLLEMCALMDALSSSLQLFGEYIEEHAGEPDSEVALGLACDALNTFLHAEKTVRQAVDRNLPKIMGRFTEVAGGLDGLQQIIISQLKNDKIARS